MYENRILAGNVKIMTSLVCALNFEKIEFRLAILSLADLLL